ncbi:2-C-methyl-D-erythritol 4-phosphate cytidylyltransferase [Enterocloster aldenensis]|uniref:IspD/TarI family cytidylyltransferase n=1 Tax=Enterocloster aldenensis TaxID=358742 RepID=UPI004027B771
MNVAVILAGGTGTRIGANIPKQFIKVFGKPILAYTMEVFQRNRNIDAIEVVCNKNWLGEVHRIVDEYHLDKTKWITTGGDTFQRSTLNGITNLKDKLDIDDIVVISFGVSPMTTDEVIDDSIRLCKRHGNAIASEDMIMCTCIKDINDGERSSVEPILRETIKGFANPWTFKFGELCDVYENAIKSGILDDSEPHTTSLYFALGKRVFFSKGTNNICKITYPEDINTFKGWLLLKLYKEGKIHMEVENND